MPDPQTLTVVGVFVLFAVVGWHVIDRIERWFFREVVMKDPPPAEPAPRYERTVTREGITVTVRYAERGLWCPRCAKPSAMRFDVLAGSGQKVGSLLWCADENAPVTN